MLAEYQEGGEIGVQITGNSSEIACIFIRLIKDVLLPDADARSEAVDDCRSRAGSAQKECDGFVGLVRLWSFRIGLLLCAYFVQNVVPGVIV